MRGSIQCRAVKLQSQTCQPMHPALHTPPLTSWQAPTHLHRVHQEGDVAAGSLAAHRLLGAALHPLLQAGQRPLHFRHLLCQLCTAAVALRLLLCQLRPAQRGQQGCAARRGTRTVTAGII